MNVEEILQMVEEDLVSYHIEPPVNDYQLGYKHCLEEIYRRIKEGNVSKPNR